MTSKPVPPRRIRISVPVDDFRPLPLTRNAHVQTILAALWDGPKLLHPTRMQILPLDDGDALMIYDCVPEGWRAGDRMALLVHGLTGSHASPQLQRMARHLLAVGVRVVRMDQRGTANGLPLARGSYHAGRSDDVRAVLAEMHRWSPASPLLLHGTSLGGNMVLKLAGEAANVPVPGLDRVSAMSPPIDMVNCSELLTHRVNRRYDQRFTSHLLREVERRAEYFPDLPQFRFPPHVTVRLFDELHTAPRNGFTDALEYYTRSSAAPIISRSPVPTLILTARDDPFIGVAAFEALQVPDHIEVVIVPHGGHVAFLGRDGLGGVRWGEHRLVHWLTAPHPE